MSDILYLVHRIPYPPNKGDKIRSFNILRQLSKTHRVHLGTFVDDPADWVYVDEVSRFCGETCFVKLSPMWAKVRSLKGLMTGEALTFPYYGDKRLAAWVDHMLDKHTISSILVYSSSMAQYVRGEKASSIRRVIDFVDIDSDKWRQYSVALGWPWNHVYGREARKLHEAEKAIAKEFNHSVFVSEAEAQAFRNIRPDFTDRVSAVNNGVDTEFFSPTREYPNPYPEFAKVLVFTGAMDYWANVDAVTWFCREVFPRVHASVAQARLYIVGSRPTKAVQKLAANGKGVCVTGRVDDIRPYLAHAQGAVAPLRVARGVQNKVLEAMAMGKPVLVTPAAIDGIEVHNGLQPLVCDHVDALVGRAIALLKKGDCHHMGPLGRKLVMDHYAWPSNLGKFKALLGFDDVTAAGDSVPRLTG